MPPVALSVSALRRFVPAGLGPALRVLAVLAIAAGAAPSGAAAQGIGADQRGAGPVPAQATDAPERRPSHCIALARTTPGLEFVHRASFTGPVAEFSVKLSYIDHAMFLIETTGGLTAVTDYNGFLGPAEFVPDVVTMNRAHSTHWTANPDPAIPYVLPGWNTEGPGPVDHYVDLGEMVVRNVSTNIRGGFSTEPVIGGNSIFVFEVEGLCIGHLGHLHHVPSDAQFAALGRLDVVMAPVDGGLTLTLPEMIETLSRLRSSIVIPMHWFSIASLNAFLAGMQDDFRIDVRDGREIEVSLRTLPSDPTVVVLRPQFLGFNDGLGAPRRGGAGAGTGGAADPGPAPPATD
ncbi:MAG: MBL fold metallo-hydrolase [Pseudomonadota bacterium]